MCNNHYGNARLTDEIVNLTDRVFRMYEETMGNVELFEPKELKLPKMPKIDLKEDESIVHYVVSRKTLKKLKREGRELDDIAVVLRWFDGKSNDMVYLAWAKEPNVKVLLYNNAHTVHFNHR